MGFLEPILRRVGVVKEIRELKEELSTLASQLAQLKQQVAKLQAATVIREDMIVDGSVYFIKKDGSTLDGPFCTSCFDQNHERVRIVPAAKPKGAEGRQSEWVQCSKCQAPFHSKRASEHLTAPRTAPTGTSPEKKARPVRKAPAKGRTRRPTAAKKAKRRRQGPSGGSPKTG